MKRLAYLLPAVALVFALGCTPKESPEDTPPPPQAPASQTETTAPVQEAVPAAPAEPESAGKIVEDYAHHVVSTPDKARAANAKTEMASLQTVIESYYADNQRYPSSLDEVKGDMQAGFDMSRFNYDPATGRVSLK